MPYVPLFAYILIVIMRFAYRAVFVETYSHLLCAQAFHSEEEKDRFRVLIGSLNCLCHL